MAPAPTSLEQRAEKEDLRPASVTYITEDHLATKAKPSRQDTAASLGTTLVSVTPVLDHIKVGDAPSPSVEIPEGRLTESSSTLNIGEGASAGTLQIARRKRAGKRLTGWMMGLWKK